MSFADNAIGFYLQVEDQLSPVLAKAQTNYEKFVKGLSKWNAAAIAEANKGMASLAAVVTGFQSLPAAAAKSYEHAIASMQKKADKAKITQKISLELDKKSKAGIAKAVAQGLSKVLKGVSLRLTATMPLKKTRPFDTSQSLRAAYGEQVQPPDMRGFFQGLPKFATGGVVSGPRFPADSIVARLTGGEEVVPAKLRGTLNQLLDTVKESLSNAQALQALAVSGIDPAASGRAAKALAMANKELSTSRGLARDLAKAGILNPRHLKQVADRINDVSGAVDSMNGELKELTGMERLLSKVLDPVRFLALKGAMEGVSTHLGAAKSQAASLFGELDGGRVQGFRAATREIAVGWGDGTDALSGFRDEMSSLAWQADLDLNVLAQASRTAVEAGLDTWDTLRDVVPAASLAAEAGLGGLTNSLASMRAQFDFNQNQAAQFTASMISLNQQTGLGGGFIESFASKLSDAAAGNREATISLRRLGITADDVAKAKMGDASAAVAQLTTTMQSVARSGNQAVLQEVLGIEASTTAIARFRTRGDEIAANIRKASDAVRDSADATAELSKQQRAGEAAWKFFGRAISTVTDRVAGPVLEFFEEFNPIMVVSIALLVKMGVQTLIAAAKAIPAIAAWAGSLFTFAAANTAKDASLVKSAAVSTVAAPAFGGLAAGLLALAPAIPVILVLALAVVALGAALWLATPAISAIVLGVVELAKVFGSVLIKIIEVVGDVIKTVVGGVVDLVKSLVQLRPSQLMGVAAGLAAVGISMPLFGVGLVAFSALAAASVPGLLLFGTVMAVFGGKAGRDIGSVVMSIMAQFSFDPRRLDRALRSLDGAVKFIRGFAALAAMMAGLALGSMIGNAVNTILGFFGIASPMEQLAKQGREVATTINELIASFLRIDDSAADSLMSKLDFTGRFFAALRPLFQRSIELGQVAGELGNSWWGLVSGPLAQLRDAGPDLKRTIESLVANLGAVTISDRALGRIESAAALFEHLSSVLMYMRNLARHSGSVDLTQVSRALGLIQEGTLQVQSQLNVNPPNAAEIRATMEANTENGRMVGLLSEQNELLRQLVHNTLGIGSPTQITQVNKEGRPARPPSDLTRRVATGDL